MTDKRPPPFKLTAEGRKRVRASLLRSLQRRYPGRVIRHKGDLPESDDGRA